jgi:putative heme iron utilization protein
LVLVACSHAGMPLLLISGLAEHTKNIRSDDRASLLYEATAGLDSPLTGSRVSLLGRVRPTDDPEDRARFLRRHPEAARYADFKDFRFFRLVPSRAHLVAGFGRIHWLEEAELLTIAAPALAEAEAGVVEHMNGEHADALQLYAVKLLGLTGGGWMMTGCDPAGCDLRRGGEVARVRFARPVADAAGARAELVRLVKAARAKA